MSKMAKAARAAMKKKAESMTAGDPHAKVDASSWTPPEMMNTEAKTGLRPISRRAYKKGGKVVAVSGKDVVHHAGKKARKAAGGEAAKYANAKVNRNVKEANAEIGKPHIGGYAGGGYAKGGRKGKMDGGMMGSGMMMGDPRLGVVNPKRLQFAQNLVTPGMKKGGHVDISADKKLIKKALRQHEVAEHGGKHVPLKLKKGGASCYADGGDVDADDVIKTPPTPSTNLPTQADIDRYNAMLAAKAEAEKARKESQSQSQKPAKAHGGSTERPFRYVGSQELKRSDLGLGMKRDESGKFENPVLSAARSADEPMQRKIPSASELKSKYQEFRSKKPFSPPEQSWRNKLVNKLRGDDKYARGGKTKGGMSMSEMGGNYTGGTRPTGGRIARKDGGGVKKGKGKTNINIVIATKPDSFMGMPQRPPMAPPSAPPAMPMMPPPGALPPGLPPGAPPMPPVPPGAMMGRKAGGRVYRTYKDMDAGAGSGLGRLEKAEIQEHKPRKAGGRTYRSYKDMDAGAGSGLGRKEKTEIQKHK